MKRKHSLPHSPSPYREGKEGGGEKELFYITSMVEMGRFYKHGEKKKGGESVHMEADSLCWRWS